MLQCLLRLHILHLLYFQRGTAFVPWRGSVVPCQARSTRLVQWLDQTDGPNGDIEVNGEAGDRFAIGNDRKERSHRGGQMRNGAKGKIYGEYSDELGSVVCRVVGQSDGKLPPVKDLDGAKGSPWPEEIYKLDVIYHAMAHEETRELEYMNRSTRYEHDDEEERKLMSTLRASLDDAGFQLLDRRDLELCEALNAGYLLRLSIVPDLSQLDDTIASDFYPELAKQSDSLGEILPFDGRVLVFRRGYTAEESRGQLLVQKLDYLQASVVQRSALWLRKRLVSMETNVARRVIGVGRQIRVMVVGRMPTNSVSIMVQKALRLDKKDDADFDEIDEDQLKELSFFKLSRYGGSKIKFVGSPDIEDALDPFIICALDAEGNPAEFGMQDPKANYELNSALNQNSNKLDLVRSAVTVTNPLPATLLERVSLSNVVDYFTRERGAFFKRLFSEAKLVEPTYEEVSPPPYKPRYQKQKS